MYQEAGLAAARDWLGPALFARAEALLAGGYLPPKSRLQEQTQRGGRGTPVYSLIAVSGAEHERTFDVVVLVEGRALGRGRGPSRRAAEQAAAKGLYAATSGAEGIYVATVRSLVQRAAISPAMGNRKVFIVGDAERMVPQEGADMAANAFLKLLEAQPDVPIVLMTGFGYDPTHSIPNARASSTIPSSSTRDGSRRTVIRWWARSTSWDCSWTFPRRRERSGGRPSCPVSTPPRSCARSAKCRAARDHPQLTGLIMRLAEHVGGD